MSIGPGDRLGPYEIVAPLGAGGMGEVWRARDAKLEREVALKFLPASFAADPERLARFEREAKVLAALNHPNIAAIYGFHEHDEHRFLAMELVAGSDLAARLTQGSLPLAEAIEIARQVAAGLEAAHAIGVVHRDLKPANVQRTPDGTVKLLDFGLAKALESPDRDRQQSMTVTSAGSTAGMIMGTAAYMSPEQARGQLVDRRTDLWALGCLIYEMLSGKRAFDGPTITDVLAAVVTRDPDWSTLPADTPTPLRRLLRRCLEKDARKRLRDAGDASLLLEDNPEDAIAQPFVSAGSARTAPAWQRALPWGLVLVFGAALLAALAMKGRAPLALEPMVLSAKLPPNTKLAIENNPSEASVLAISRDGRHVAFVGATGASRQLFVRSSDRLQATPIPGTNGASSPFFSPDGRWIAFFTSSKLKKISIEGGQPIELGESGMARGGVWCDDGTIVFSPTTSSGLVRLPSGGGKPVPLTTLDPAKLERTHRWPALLPGGEIAFTVGTADKPGTYEDSRIDAVNLATGARRALTVGASMVRYAASGHLLLGRDNQLFAMPLAAAKGGAVSNATPVIQGVDGVETSGVVFFDVAENGTLVYAERDPQAKALELVRVDREGRAEQLPFPPREYHAPRLAPDGRRIAFGIGPGRGGASDVWIGDLRSGEVSRLTFDGQSDFPIWSRDGHRVAYGVRTTAGGEAFASKAVDGSDTGSVVASFGGVAARGPTSFTPDGRSFIYQQDGGADRSADVMVLSLSDGESTEVAATAAIEFGGDLSPDGRFLAYASDASGQFEVYVQPFPAPGGQWQISDGGTSPRWAVDGKTLYYVSVTGTMMEVQVETAKAFTHGKPKALYETRFPTNTDTATNYDVTPDGRFIMVRTASEMRTAEHLDVVVNFFGLLR